MIYLSFDPYERSESSWKNEYIILFKLAYKNVGILFKKLKSIAFELF